MSQQWVGITNLRYHNMIHKKATIITDLFHFWTILFFEITDHSVGFGGKYGVQTDRMDSSAKGWDFKEKSEAHASQKGVYWFIVRPGHR